MLPIVRYNQPILRQKGAKVTVFDDALASLSRQMIETMKQSEGIGLAAQQIGRAIQLCVIDLRAGDWDYEWLLDGARPPRDIFMPFAMVNPRVTPRPGTTETVYEEGCLSFPEIRGDVARPDWIAVDYQDVFGVSHVLACNGLLSRCIQHEVDHLNGTLFIDRMEKKVRAKIDRLIKELAKKTKEASVP